MAGDSGVRVTGGGGARLERKRAAKNTHHTDRSFDVEIGLDWIGLDRRALNIWGRGRGWHVEGREGTDQGHMGCVRGKIKACLAVCCCKDCNMWAFILVIFHARSKKNMI